MIQEMLRSPVNASARAYVTLKVGDGDKNSLSVSRNIEDLVIVCQA